MDYGTRYRLVNHVAYPAKKSPILLRCQHYYLNHVQKLDPELVKQLDAEEDQNVKSLKNRRLPAHFCPFPPFRVCGPLDYNSFWETWTSPTLVLKRGR